jgi:hypothetical protein
MAQEKCCTPEGQIKRYLNCIGCDRKPDNGITMAQQTAVEWYSHELRLWFDEQSEFSEHDQIMGKANQLLKEALGRAYIAGARSGFGVAEGVNDYANFEEYYNETYGK